MRGSAPSDIYSSSLHDALPIFGGLRVHQRDLARLGEPLRGPAHHRLVDPLLHDLVADVVGAVHVEALLVEAEADGQGDRKSTRLNSSHLGISYAVLCLKKTKDL